jgi:hypothetical protein
VYLENQAAKGATSGASPTDEGAPDATGPLPFGPSAGTDPSSTPQAPAGGPSSLPPASDATFFAARPSSAGGTGSPLVDEILGAAHTMGLKDVQVPALPTQQLPATNPLRFAIVAWIAATGSKVPADQLSTQLAQADALPQPLQKDLALVILSAAQASILQQVALAKLSPADVAWVYAHPELADQLAKGVSTPDTQRLAALAGKVDMKSSLEASLLVVEAVEATRGDLASYQAKHVLEAAPALAQDPSTAALIRLIASASGGLSDADKIRLAARIVATSAHLPAPAEPTPIASFADAVQGLVKASSMAPDPAALSAALARADALPADLPTALATLVSAESNAINAANPQLYTPTGRLDALVDVLMATAYAMPTLEKYNLFWRDAPSALRVGQWTPAAAAGYALEESALLLSARGDPVAVARAEGYLHGGGLVSPTIPARTLTEAYAALEAQARLTPDAKALASVDQAAATLAPAVRDAAAIMMSGAAESARYQRLAFANLTPQEQAWLTTQTLGLDGLYAQASPTQAQLDALARASLLAERVNATALANAEVVGVMALAQARQTLASAGYAAQAEDVRAAPTIWARLAALLPVGSASAQSAACVDLGSSIQVGVVDNDCANDVLLRIHLSVLPSSSSPECDGSSCWAHFGDANDEALVLLGTGGSNLMPETGTRFECAESPAYAQDRAGGAAMCADGSSFPSQTVQVPRYGAATVLLDLGGSDTYDRPVAATSVNATLPVSLHLDMGGSNVYLDPTSLYDGRDPMIVAVGRDAGMPTEGSAEFGGVAVLFDADSAASDSYTARTHGIGFGRFGLGMVVDLGGNDLYAGGNFTQGAGSEEYNLGGGILLDAGGNDRYVATVIRGAAQGYGLGGVLLDVQGKDSYTNRHDPLGLPASRLNVLPGGDLGSLSSRGDNRVWIDGDSGVNVGLGLDEDASTGPNLGRGLPGIEDFVAQEQGRVGAIAQDSDGDTFPDFIESAFGTDPHGAASYPAGFPRGPILDLPLQGNSVNDDGGKVSNDAPPGTPVGSDKIVDLRLPTHNLGGLDGVCLGREHLNASGLDGSLASVSGGTPVSDNVDGQAAGTDQGDTLHGQDCAPTSITFGPNGTGSDQSNQDNFSFQLPTGILAIGDSVDTTYSVDYLVAIDLGGNDRFLDVAGGATPILTTPSEATATSSSITGTTVSYQQAFLAPTLAINVDPSLVVQAIRDPQPGCGCDAYLPAKSTGGDYSQGSMYGVLVDTGGSDRYFARNVSQGAVGGVLLDLSGTDLYFANSLSQGASLAGFGTGVNGATGLPSGDGRFLGKDSADRRAVPGLLLDAASASDALGGANFFQAASNSQGFARGFPLGAALNTGSGGAGPANNTVCDLDTQGFGTKGSGSCQQSPDAVGLLISAGPNTFDSYAGQTKVQGVGGGRGLGALFDLGSTADSYAAQGAISQGAPLGEATSAGTGIYDPAGNATEPGAGLLVDLAGGAGGNAYTLGAQTRDRAGHVTITRADAPVYVSPGGTQVGGAHLYDDVGIDADLNATSADASHPTAAGILPAIFGGDVQGSAGKLLDIPAARLAIGDSTGTAYNGTDYALIVDLGGANAYNDTGAGFVADALASAEAQPSGQSCVAAACERPTLSLYPVSLLLDAGSAGSSHVASRPLSQGAGFFSVGVLADLGGNDAYSVVSSPQLSFGLGWAPRVPVFDGNVNYGPGAEWNATLRSRNATQDVITRPAGSTLNLTSLQDPRLVSPFKVTMENDGRALYLAIEGLTRSTAATGVSGSAYGKQGDRLSVDINPGATHAVFDAALNRTGLLRVGLNMQNDGSACAPPIVEAMNVTPTGQLFSPDAASAVIGKCRVANGRFYAEIAVPLLPGLTRDPLALAYTQDADGKLHYCANVPGCVDDAAFAVRLQFHENATGNDYAWPAGTTDVEGAFNATSSQPSSTPPGSVVPFMLDWATVQLAQAGSDAIPPALARTPDLTQGAAVAGVGIVANLGTGASDKTFTAGERSQAYAAYGGLAMLLSASGSDVYTAGALSQAAAQTQGVSLFLASDGNDRYVLTDPVTPRVRNDGYVPSAGDRASATFLDLGGADVYDLDAPAACEAQHCAFLPSGGSAGAIPPAKNQRAWVSQDRAAASTGGAGVDADIVDTYVRNQLAPTLETALYAQAALTRLGMSPADPAAPFGCAPGQVPTRNWSAAVSNPVLSGTVCLRAHVDLTPRAQSASTTIDHVDFLLDGRPVLSVPNPDPAAAVVDLAGLLDTTRYLEGVHDLTARTAIRVAIQPPAGSNAPVSTMLLYDDSSASLTPDPSSARVLVSNAPLPSLALAPAFATTNASAVVSAIASDPTKARLDATYAVSHDADEERLNAFMRWAPSAEQSAIPCEPAATRLCSLLPLYLPDPALGTNLTTTPTNAALGTAYGEQGDAQAFSVKTSTLGTPLTIATKDAFHVHLNDHTPLLPGQAYTTRILVHLDGPSGSKLQVGGQDVLLANATVVNDFTTPGATAGGLLGDNYAATRGTVYGAFEDGEQGVAGLRHFDPGPALGALLQNCCLIPSVSHTVSDKLNGTSEAGTLDPYTETAANTTEGNLPATDTGFSDFFLDLQDSPALRSLGVVPSADGTGLTIPPGYGISLEIFDAPNTVVVPEHTGDSLDTVEETYGSTLNQVGIVSTPVLPLTALLGQDYSESLDRLVLPTHVVDPALPAVTDQTINVTAALIAPVDNVKQSLQQSTLNKTLSNGPPVAFFFTGTGDATSQSRLDVRVPAEPSTLVTLQVLDAAGTVRRTLVSERPTAGSLPGQADSADASSFAPHVVYLRNGTGSPYSRLGAAWRGEDDHGNRLPDGVYTVRLAAQDPANPAVALTQNALLDSTPPLTTITTPDHISSAMLVDNGIPLAWSVAEGDTGSGVSTTRLYVWNGQGSLADPTKWVAASVFGAAEGDNEFDGSTTAVHAKAPGATPTTSYWMAISRDFAGNVEAACRTTCDPGLRTAEDFYKAAIANKLALGAGVGYKAITLDTQPPSIVVPADQVAGLGGLSLNHVSFHGTPAYFVPGGQPVAFRVCAQDANSPGQAVAHVAVTFDYIDPVSLDVTSYSRDAALDSTGAPCPAGYQKWAFGGWGAEDANKTLFPDGAWTVSAAAYDAAGNVVIEGFDPVILDSQAPNVTAQAPIYPAGQSAVKPGDSLTLRLSAADAFGLDDAPGSIVFDATALNQTPGNVAARPAREGTQIFQEATFRVDKRGLVDGHAYLVAATVRDRAGNPTRVTFQIPVSFASFSFNQSGSATSASGVRVLNVGYDSVTLAWNTSSPTTGYVRYGTSNATMADGPRNETLAYAHVVTLAGLAPSTRYLVRAGSTSAGGVVNLSDPLAVTTASALYLTLTSPQPSADGKPVPLSGAVPILFQGGLRGAGGLVRYTLQTRASPHDPWTFVTTLTQGGDTHALSLNSSRYLDGASYQIMLTAEAGPDAAHMDSQSTPALGPFLLDNTPPDVEVVAPLVATKDAQPTLVASADDNLAGFGAAPASLAIDGQPVGRALNATGTAEGISLRYAIPTALAEGPHTFDLRVVDRAGNLAEQVWTVVVDNDPPLALVNPTGFAPGLAAAKAGGTVTLNLTLTDASGVASATADTSGLSSQATTRLVRLPGTSFYGGTAPVTLASPAVSVPVHVAILDLAGNERDLTIPVVVDNTPPVAQEPTLTSVDYTRAVVSVVTSEPAVLQGAATASGSPPVSAATTSLVASPALELKGLLPSRTYAYEIKVLDAAGNAVTVSGNLATKVDSEAPSKVGANVPGSGVSVDDLLNGTLRLSWPPATDNVGVSVYRVYRSDDGGATYKPIAEVQGLSYDDAGLALEKKYAYEVVAVDYGGNEGLPSTPITASATEAPSLSAGAATPTLGSTSTLFRYVVTYMSPGNVAPAYVHLVLDGVPVNMTSAGAGTYVYETKLAPHKRDAPHTYSFEASDGRYVVKFPLDGKPLRGPLVTIDGSDAGATGFAAFAQRVPLGGAALVSVALVAAAALAALVLRKKKEGSK